eukprot:421426-Rhodomonas_salina.1
MDDSLLSLWCQMRLALRLPCETGVAWFPVPWGTIEFAVEDTRSGIRAVHECVAEARSNGSSLFDVGGEQYREMRAASLHSGFIIRAADADAAVTLPDPESLQGMQLPPSPQANVKRIRVI